MYIGTLKNSVKINTSEENCIKTETNQLAQTGLHFYLLINASQAWEKMEKRVEQKIAQNYKRILALVKNMLFLVTVNVKVGH